MSDREIINDYLTTFSRYLSRLSKADAEEVLREIESHIYDALEMAESTGQNIDIESILHGFGSPRELAEQYSSHMLEGTPPPAGFSAISSVKHGVSKAAYWGIWLLGYSVGVCLVVLAVLKLFLPDSVGVWVSEQGQSVVVGMVEETSQRGNELVGMWFIPLGLLLGLFCLKATHATLSAMRRLIG